ncbi:MAG: hypothetical protein ACOZNI_20175 [Myxococcota bacterium]
MWSFLSRHSGMLAALAGEPFPRTPRDCRPIRMRPFASAPQAIEYTSLSLLSHTDRLQQFENFREALVGPMVKADENILSELESALGYSAWLAGQWIGSLPTRSSRQVKLVQAIRASDRFGLYHLIALEKYFLSGEGQPASGIVQYLRGKSYPTHLRALLLACLDPIPDLSADAVCHALRGSLVLSAVDRWAILLRCVQSLRITDEKGFLVLRDSFALPLLLRKVASVESDNLLAELGHGRSHACLPVSPLDQAVRQFVGGGPPLGHEGADTQERVVVGALHGLAQEGAVAGHLAVLDRQSLALSGTRTGAVLAAAVVQASAFTDRRSRTRGKWLDLCTHPAVSSDIADGRFGRVVRLRSAPEAARVRLEQALLAAATGDHAGVLHLLAGHAHLPEEAAILLDALLATGRTEEAVDLAARLIVEESPLLRRMPFRDLHALVPEDPAEDLPSALRRAIVSDACVRYGASLDLAKRNDCLDDVLELSETRFPSKAVDRVLQADVPVSLVAYFLETICTPTIMDTVPVGRSTEELLQERINVLHRLGELVPEKVSVVELEIRQTAIVIAAKREMLSLDQRRVYVDLDGLRARLLVLLADDYDRYTRFTVVDTRKHTAADTIKRIFREQGMDAEVFDVEDIARSLTSEADGALFKMLILVRYEFANGPDFGLDGYLSGGIRHGNLEAHLREPFVKMDLLGSFAEGGAFRAPPLAKQLSALPFCDSPSGVSRAFEVFARTFQEVVDEVLSQWVRIEFATGNPRALFQFQLITHDVRLFEMRARKATTLEEFTDLAIEYWLARLDQSLEAARVRIRGELASRLHAALAELDSAMRRLFPGDGQSALADNMVAPARGALDAALEKLEEWFRRGALHGQGDVDASLPIEISTKLVQNAFPQLKFTWHRDIDVGSCRLDRRVIKPWVDIIHTLLVNAAQEAVRHGGPTAACSVRILLQTSDRETRLEVTNKLGSALRRAAADQAIEEAHARLARVDALASVRAEGRSGLVKVLKWARIDLRCNEACVVVRRDEDEFVAVVRFPGWHAGLLEAA